ncbi:hypothetical protein FF098_017330 [Parvularcula flava]|uniref:Type I restriction modification DNA specificity domain-containing protein n=1 Tax=Aquisalinus luteolus TaxID=1566827 RepID=A0A8J3A6C4_9PROT|nr:restriction endonuclease subunit S [Aquisalinus luteolus]NHK29672.1 hypothetical protein [Aquisalinus luteolus]GGI02150.1 hypothetical protein GCM10011355_34470 [Aquisalinus luteolus]
MSAAAAEKTKAEELDERDRLWSVSTIGEVAEVNPSKAKIKLDDDDTVSFVPMAAVEPLSNTIDLSETRKFASVKKNFTRFLEDDVLFAKITPCMENGKVAVAKGLHQGRGCGTTEFHILRPTEAIISKYLFYFVVSDKFRNLAKRNMSGAVGQQRVPADFVRNSEIPIPPLAEQKRIVSKIDELFSDIEAGERALQRARKALERYRRSVLKAAVTGALTADWREKNRDRLEPADKLLTRILDARRTAWEKAELAKMKAKGKEPKGDAWKKKYGEAKPPKYEFNSTLPISWLWLSFSTIGNVSGGLTKNKKRNELPHTRPYLRVANVYENRLDLTEIHSIGVTERELERVELQRFDLLIVEGNGSKEQIGRAALWDASIKGCVHQNHLIKVRFSDSITSRYSMVWLRSPFGRTLVEEVASSTSGLHTLSISKIEQLPLAFPPQKEQEEILSRVEEAFSKADRVAAALDEQERAAKALRQSILKAAFEGRLVPQDPDDEPAEKLLKRIRQEKKG